MQALWKINVHEEFPQNSRKRFNRMNNLHPESFD